jgi:hypothetical protein
MTEERLNVLINTTLSPTFLAAPTYHGTHTSPKGTAEAYWVVDHKGAKPVAKMARLLSELAKLMIVLENTEAFATLSINTRSV